MSSTTLVWFGRDLRLDDHAPLVAAAHRGAIIPVFIWSPTEEAPWAPGAASRWWLHHALASLDEALRARGLRLVRRQGPALDTLRTLIAATGADALYWGRRYEPALGLRDESIAETLHHEGVDTRRFNTSLLFDPWTLKTKSGKPYQVFTPFWNACHKEPPPAPPLKIPTRFIAPSHWPRSEALETWTLLPRLPWADGFKKVWTPGEKGATRALKRFLSEAMSDYSDGRNRPADAGTSYLSPYLHFGHVSPRQVWHAVARYAARASQSGVLRGAEIYLKEIGWREFAHHVLYHFPHTIDTPLRPRFKALAWRKDAAALQRWQRGETGYPIVDAGLRQLWSTGWMHNRVRMIVGSFLVKDLLIPWQTGAEWFWDTLLDADLANNSLNWQWVAGCGADAAPYYRVFNPILQGEKFDPQGAYVRRWIPELKDVPTKMIHHPWTLTPPPNGYPPPIVDHGDARVRALSMFKRLSK